MPSPGTGEISKSNWNLRALPRIRKSAKEIECSILITPTKIISIMLLISMLTHHCLTWTTQTGEMILREVTLWSGGASGNAKPMQSP